MADVNKVILIGRLTRDPQLKFTPSQIAICEFGLAIGRKFKTASGEQREETTFIDCTVWSKGAEIFSQYMTKGKQVYVEGRLKLDSWEDKNGGGKRSKLTVTVDEFQFLGDRAGTGNGTTDAEDDQTQQGRKYPHPKREQPQGAPVPSYGDEQTFNDEDIPF